MRTVNHVQEFKQKVSMRIHICIILLKSKNVMKAIIREPESKIITRIKIDSHDDLVKQI